MIRYMILTNLYALVLFALYIILLRNRTGQQWSRFYLLFAVMAAVITPLVFVNLSFERGDIMPALVQRLPEIIVSRNPGISGENIPVTVYCCGVGAMLGLFLFRLARMYSFFRKADFIPGRGYRLALNTGVGPASFGNVIIFPGNEITPGILKHEIAHKQRKHHIDKIFISLVLCFFFPVVAFYFIKKELEIVHEFEADRIAAGDKEQYVALLLHQNFQGTQIHLLQSFFHHPLKRRIQMLYKKKTNENVRRGALVALSAIVFTAGILLQSGVLRAQVTEPLKKEKVYDIVEKMPEFSGGNDKLATYMINNLKYPENSRRKGIQGRVVAKFTVDKSGAIKNVEIIKSLNRECDAEVLRIVNAMPAWTPGEKQGEKVSVHYVLPVAFKL